VQILAAETLADAAEKLVAAVAEGA
jgi:hypothetical protein